MKRQLIGILVLSVTLATAGSAGAGLVQEPVKTKAKVDEFTPAATAGYLAWSQNSTAKPKHFDAYIQPDGGARVKVNAAGTIGFGGGFSDDGAIYAYQQVRRGNSDIKLYHVDTRTRTNPPSSVDTKAWEWHPTISGNYLLFGREKFRLNPEVWQVVLTDLTTGTSKILASLRGNGFPRLRAGQVSGDFAVYDSYTPSAGGHVWRYQISTGDKQRLPRTAAANYNGSVAPDGDVYFMQSGPKCGQYVKIMRWDGPGNDAVQLAALGRKREAIETYTYEDPDGNRHVYYARFTCGVENLDVYRVTDPAPPVRQGVATRQRPSSPTSGPRAWRAPNAGP